MRVLGIDPGFATTGYAVVERRKGSLVPVSAGAIRTAPDATRPARLSALRRAVLEIIAATEPRVAAVERLFFNSNVRTAMAVGQAAGVALCAIGDAGLEAHEYTPLEVKRSVVGVGTASKKQVQVMVAALLKLDEPPSPPDAADACALAICHLNRSGLARALERAAL